MNAPDIQAQVNAILNKNKIDDLTRFLQKRQCLNKTNVWLNYMFHFVQSAGIFTTTLAAGYNIKELVWGGIALNIIASLINVFEQTNNTISKRIMKDIVAIKQGKYVDEGLAVEPEKEDSNAQKKNAVNSASDKSVDDSQETKPVPIANAADLETPLLDGNV
jgi:hypothetical protein